MKKVSLISALWLALVSFLYAAPNILIEGWDGIQWKNISDNDLNPNQQVTDFDTVDFNSSKDRSYRIRNTNNNDALTVFVNSNSITSTSSQFSFPGFPSSNFVIAGGASRQFTIRYRPVTSGRTSTIRIDSNSGNSGSAERTYTFAVRGTGREGEISVNYNPSSGSDVGIADGAAASTGRGTDFGTRRVGGGSVTGQSLTRNFYLRNSSEAPGRLIYSAASLSGSGASHFSISGLNGGGLNEGNNDNFSITFNPSSRGVKNATVTITSNDANESPFTFALTGEGTAFSEVRVQGRRILTGATLSQIFDNDTTPRSEDGTRFDNTLVGESNEMLVRVHNDGDRTLTLTGRDIVGSGSAAFSFVGLVSSVAPGDSGDFRIRFTPTAGQTYAATFQVVTNDSNENPFNFALRGTGLASEVALQGRNSNNVFTTIASDRSDSPSVNNGTNFGQQNISSGAAQRSFRIRNFGNSNLRISSRQFIGDDEGEYGVSGLLSFGVRNIAAGGFHDFTISYDPEDIGTDNAIFEMTTNDPDESLVRIDLRGIGIGFPEIRVRGRRFITGTFLTEIEDGDTTPQSADGTRFDNTLVGQSKEMLVRVHNDGNAPLSLSGRDIVGNGSSAFSFIDGFVTVPPNDSEDFRIRFTPPASQTYTATFQVVTNDPDEGVFNFAIRGTGLAPEISLSGRDPDNIDRDIAGDRSNSPSINNGTNFGQQDIGSGAAQRTFRIRNSGNSNLKISARRFIGDSDDEFDVSGLLSLGVRNIAAGDAHEFTISYDPENIGTDNAIFEMTTDDPDEETFRIDLRAEGIGVPKILVRGLSGVGIASTIDRDDLNPDQDVTTFSNVRLGESFDRFFRIRNDGTAPLVLTSATSTNSNFIISSVQTTIAAGESDDFRVRYTPTDLDDDERTIISIGSNADPGATAYRFTLKANSVGPVIRLFGGSGLTTEILDGDTTPSEQDGTIFPGRNPDGGSVTTPFLIKNEGNRVLNIQGASRITGPGADSFSISGLFAGNPIITIAAGFDQSFNITFDPTTTGVINATLVIETNADDSTEQYTVDLSGIGLDPNAVPNASVRGNNLIIRHSDTFPRIADGTNYGTLANDAAPETRTFTLQNTSNQSALNISGVSVTNAGRELSFSVATSLPSSIPANGSSTFAIRLNPSVATGVRNGTVTITTDDPDTPSYTFSVTGEIEEPETSDSPPTISSGRVGDDLVFVLETPSGVTYKITTSTDLSATTWQTVPGQTGLTSGTITLEDLFANGVAPTAFFRLEEE